MRTRERVKQTRKRKETSKKSVTRKGEEEEEALLMIENEDEEEEEVLKGFFACYLLCSLSPRFKDHWYIGFTTNPRRRIRQHNGEIMSGALQTKKKRPWEMTLCIYGFPTKTEALKFEWAWQHPKESLTLRNAAASFKSLFGISNQIKLAYTMLTLLPWQSLKLTVNFFSTKYMERAAGCPSLPKQMKAHFCPMDELPCYASCDQILVDNEDDEDEYDENGSDCRNEERSVRNTSAYYWSTITSGHDRMTCDRRSLFHPVDPVGWIHENCNEWGQPSKQHLETSATSNEDQPRCTKSNHSSSQFDSIHLSYTSRDENSKPHYSLFDSSMETAYSSTSDFDNNVEKVPGRDFLGLIEKRRNGAEQSAKQLQSPSVSNSLLSTGVEVIDMETAYSSTFDLDDNLGKLRRNMLGLIEEHSTGVGLSAKQQLMSPSDANVEVAHSSTFDLDSNVEKLQGKDFLGLIEEHSNRVRQSAKQQPESPLVTNNPFSPGVEVINILTPSSDCTIRAFRKKKRVSWACHEIIDLTRSPGFIQL